MARKQIQIRIRDEGRDFGKLFMITELPASQAEKWGLEALVALVNSGIMLPDEVQGSGIAGVASAGFDTLMRLRMSDLEPLMEKMFQCITFCPDPNHQDLERQLCEDDIEEISTRIKLRKEVWNLHVSFLPPDVLSKLSSMGKRSRGGSNTIPTSQETSDA